MRGLLQALPAPRTGPRETAGAPAGSPAYPGLGCAVRARRFALGPPRLAGPREATLASLAARWRSLAAGGLCPYLLSPGRINTSHQPHLSPHTTRQPAPQ